MKKLLLIPIFALYLSTVYAQIDGARTYWAMPKNLNILSAHKISANVNASVNNLSFVTPQVTASNNLYLLTYTRSQPIFGRTFYSTLFLPAGDITTTINADIQGPGAISNTMYQHGLGDLIWSNTVNLVGAPGLMIKDFLRHENPTLVYFQTAVTFPTGQYNGDELLNLGSNQYKFKVGLPMVQRIGPWVDGKKTTLEVFPSYTFITKNDDLQGQEVEQEGMFIVESHLTRDITKAAFLSLDYSLILGGSSDFKNKETGALISSQEGQEAHLIGLTASFRVADQLNLFISHSQTFSSGNDNVSLEGGLLKLTLSYSFHDFQQKFNDYINSN